MKETVKESVLFFVLGVSLLVYSLVNHYSVQIEWGLSPYLFPAVIAVFMIILSVTLFAGGIRAGEKHVRACHLRCHDRLYLFGGHRLCRFFCR